MRRASAELREGQREIEPIDQRAGVDPFGRLLRVPGRGGKREERLAHLIHMPVKRFLLFRRQLFRAEAEGGSAFGNAGTVGWLICRQNLVPSAPSSSV